MKIVITLKAGKCPCGCGNIIPLEYNAKRLLQQLRDTSITIKDFRHIIRGIRLE